MTLCDDKNVLYKHSVDFACILCLSHGYCELLLYFGEIIGLSIGIAPDVDMKASIVAFEEFAMRTDPTIELFIGEAEWMGVYMPVLMSMLKLVYILRANYFTRVIMLQ